MNSKAGGSQPWGRAFVLYGRRSVLAGAVIVSGVALTKKIRSWRQNKVFAASSSSPPYDDFEPRPAAAWEHNWDRRGQSYNRGSPKSPNEVSQKKNKQKKESSSAKRHILLIRHGQYHDDAGAEKDRFLTELGLFQATMTAQRLEELKLPFTTMTSSTLTRAIETSSVIQKKLQYLQVKMDELLREGAPVLPSPPTETWDPLPSHFFQDGARIESAFRKYFHRASPEQKEDTYDMIVCHSNVIRYFVCRALQFPLNGWIRLSLANCSMTMVTIYPDGFVVLEMLGDHGHMPAESISYN